MTNSCLPCHYCQWDNEEQVLYCTEEEPEFPDRCGKFIREPGADDYLGEEDE